MRQWILATALCLPVVASSARANNWLEPINVDAGAGAHFNVDYGGAPGCGGGKAQSAPWYTYFPYQAYFQTPAPVGGYPYPYWPSPATTRQGANGQAQAPAAPRAPAAPIGAAAPRGPAPFQPVAYFPEVPSYWYGR